MKLEFTVEDHPPPKKDGANSMWNKASEFDRLVALRQAALRQLGEHPPLRRHISLRVEVFLPQPESRAAGDLDNFITGICDGLMAAHPRSSKDSRWESPSLRAVHPTKVVAIEDDSAIVSIVAQKTQDNGGRSWYRVTLEGEP